MFPSPTRFVTVLLVLASLLAPVRPVFACQLSGVRHYHCCCHDHGHCRHGGGCPHRQPGKKGCCDVGQEIVDAGLVPVADAHLTAALVGAVFAFLPSPVVLPVRGPRAVAVPFATGPPPRRAGPPPYLTTRRLRI